MSPYPDNDYSQYYTWLDMTDMYLTAIGHNRDYKWRISPKEDIQFQCVLILPPVLLGIKAPRGCVNHIIPRVWSSSFRDSQHLYLFLKNCWFNFFYKVFLKIISWHLLNHRVKFASCFVSKFFSASLSIDHFYKVFFCKALPPSNSKFSLHSII